MQAINIIAKTNQKKNILEFDKEKNCYIAYVKAPPEDNKANIEIIKLVSKQFGKQARIISGKTSKRKLITLS